jgi:uncharacterized protein
MSRVMMYLGRLLATVLLAVCARSQTPKSPFPYSEEEVAYPNPQAAGVFLAGTFTKPSGAGPFPAVLLIAGAGPQDRDETTAGHKPFLVFADYLTRRGVAVLRTDKRGSGKSTGQYETSTTGDFASDAEAGVRYLLTRPEVNSKHLGLIGHGEGGIIAPLVAVKMPQVSFLVLIGGTGLPGEQVLLEQTERAEKAAHIPPEQIKADKKIGGMLYKMVREGRSEAELRVALLNLPEDDRPFIPYWQHQLHRLESPWLRWFLAHDPATTLEKVKCPVLALDGEKDMHLVPEQNMSAMKGAFARGGNRDLTLEILPGLNHLLQPAKTGLGWEYATIPETISPAALNLIGDWVSKHAS